MAIEVRIPTILRTYTDGAKTVEGSGATLADLFSDLESRHGGLQQRLIDEGGLLPVATGAQVRIADKKISVIDGPFVETKEMIGGYAIFDLRDKEEAVVMAREFMQLHLDHMPDWEGTCEVRAMFTNPCA